MPSAFDTIAVDLHATCRDTFGTTITSYTRPGTPPTVLPAFKGVLYTRPTATSVAAGDVPVDGYEPRADLLHSDLGALAAPEVGDTFVAEGITWRIERVIPGTIGRNVCPVSEV